MQNIRTAQGVQGCDEVAPVRESGKERSGNIPGFLSLHLFTPQETQASVMSEAPALFIG